MHILAAEGNPVAVQLLPLVTTVVVFGIAFFILSKNVWPRITKGLDDRDNKIRDEIKAAEESREQARAAQAEYESSLKEARQEAAEMISKAKNDAKAAADDLRQRNEQELADLKQRAQRDIQTAKQQAVTELHSEATALAASIAGKILQREISVQDQQRLVEESLRELQPLK
ncbi:MAG: F0F1 ATP synthase subunit B [Phycisphaerales bacterium]|nr:F0F1 ATP synthase subunit B [Phycisphaerae bacterium]NNF41703.1 F0F1 ATP synthase subunit B [Phycisphaerales bacterium]NNM25573.1 F0F1 ATP synthase subunit B [Phycisphaerales bacterium]